MFVLANLLEAIAKILEIGLNIYFWIIVVRALLSWVNPDPYNPIVRFLYQVTEPVLGRIRSVLPFIGGIDISPLIAILIIIFFQRFVITTMLDMALKLRIGG